MTETQTQVSQQSVNEVNERSLLDDPALQERVAYELPKLLANIVDPNTDSKKVRSLTIKINFMPTADRRYVTTISTVTPKLLPTDPIQSNLMLHQIGNHVQAVTIGNQTPGQRDFDGNEEPEAVIIKQIK